MKSLALPPSRQVEGDQLERRSTLPMATTGQGPSQQCRLPQTPATICGHFVRTLARLVCRAKTLIVSPHLRLPTRQSSEQQMTMSMVAPSQHGKPLKVQVQSVTSSSSLAPLEIHLYLLLHAPKCVLPQLEACNTRQPFPFSAGDKLLEFMRRHLVHGLVRYRQRHVVSALQKRQCK